MLSVEKLTKNYGSKTAISGVGFSAQKGRILGLLGPNGAGKTTTMRIMTGFLEASDGDVVYDGISISEMPREIKRKLGYLPEHAPLYSEFLVREYLSFVGKAREVEGSRISSSIERVVQLCSLESVFYSPIYQLSKGFRQRVALAGTLIHDPDYIILDEPSTGLDPNQITEIRSIIRNLGQEKILILSTHILQEVVEVCDQVVILAKGKKVMDSKVEDLQKNNMVLFVTNATIDKLHPYLSKYGMKDLSSMEQLEGGWTVYTVDSMEKGSQAVFRALAESGEDVREIRPYQRSMESIFGEITKGNL